MKQERINELQAAYEALERVKQGSIPSKLDRELIGKIRYLECITGLSKKSNK